MLEHQHLFQKMWRIQSYCDKCEICRVQNKTHLVLILNDVWLSLGRSVRDSLSFVFFYIFQLTSTFLKLRNIHSLKKEYRLDASYLGL